MPAQRAAIRHRGAEIIVALALLAFGALIAWESVKIGARWTDEGPQTGYFPFYIALTICIASAWNLVRALLIRPEGNRTFVEIGQLRLVLSVLVPTAIFAVAIKWTGIYVAALLFIGYFMRRLGKYPWWKVVAGGAGTTLVLFLLFEIWFLVPLPKGPLERLLGLG